MGDFEICAEYIFDHSGCGIPYLDGSIGADTCQMSSISISVYYPIEWRIPLTEIKQSFL